MVGGGNVKSNQRYSTARVRQVEMAALRRVVYESLELLLCCYLESIGLTNRGWRQLWGPPGPPTCWLWAGGFPAKGTVIQQPFFRRQHRVVPASSHHHTGFHL